MTNVFCGKSEKCLHYTDVVKIDQIKKIERRHKLPLLGIK